MGQCGCGAVQSTSTAVDIAYQTRVSMAIVIKLSIDDSYAGGGGGSDYSTIRLHIS